MLNSTQHRRLPYWRKGPSGRAPVSFSARTASVAVWTNPYPEISSASADYATGVSSPTNTAAIGNAFALAHDNKWLIYKVVSAAGELYDCIPAPAYQDDAYSAQQAAGTMPGSPVFDTIAADFFYYPTKFKNRVSGEAAPDLNLFGCSRPTWLPLAAWALTNATLATGVLGADGATSKAVQLTTTGASAAALIYVYVPRGKWTLAFDAKADAGCDIQMSVSLFGAATKTLTTSWATYSVTMEITTVSDFNNYIYLMKAAPTGRVISIDNVRLIPGASAGSVTAFNRHGTLLTTGSAVTTISQNGMFPRNRPDTAASQIGTFIIPDTDAGGTSHSAMSLVAAVNMTGAHSSTKIEPIINAFLESGSDDLNQFFVGAASNEVWQAGGSSHAGAISQMVSLFGAGWMVVTAICDGSGSELWFNDVRVAKSTTAWTASVHRALQVFKATNSNLKSFNGEFCSLTLWNSRLSDADRATAYTEAKSRVTEHGGTFADFSTFLVIDGDSITAVGVDKWSTLLGAESHYAPRLQGACFAVANARLGTAADTSASNTLWGRLAAMRTQISNAIDGGCTVIVCTHIGANDLGSGMLATYQDSTNGIAAYYTALKATTAAGVTYADPTKVKLIGGTVLPMRLAADGGNAIYTAAVETARDDVNTYIKTLTNLCDDIADFDAAFGGVWASGNYADDVHPSATGQGLMKTEADGAVFAFWAA